MSKQNKSSQKRKRKQTNLPKSRRRTRDDSLQVRTFEITDEPITRYKPGVREEIEEAADLVARRRLDEATQMFESIISREPKAREAYANLATIYFHRGDEKAAIILLEETVEKFPRYVFPRANLARIYLRAKEVDQAGDIMIPLERSRRFTTAEFQLYTLTWADILAAEREYAGALGWVNMLADILPDASGILSRRIRFNLARLFQRKRHNKKED